MNVLQIKITESPFFGVLKIPLHMARLTKENKKLIEQTNNVLLKLTHFSFSNFRPPPTWSII
jgi:hypothetical protein